MIGFNQIPPNLRTPGVHIEFDSSLANAGSQNFKMLAVGQRLAAGTVAEGVPTLVTDKEQAANYFGAGSMLAVICAAMLASSNTVELWAIALDDAGAGTAAAGTVTVSNAPTDNGTYNLYIGGERIQVAVASTDTADNVATAIAAAITASVDCPVSAAVDGGTANQVNLTAKHKGEFGNDIDLRSNYFGETMPTGLAITFGAMAAGGGNPDIATAIIAMADEQYNWIAMPWNDSANLTALAAELDDRWGPMRQIDGRAFAAYQGTLAATGTFGNGLNNEHLTMIGSGVSPQPPYLWAAVNCAVAAASLVVDPARPLQTLALPGIMGPAVGDRWTRAERNTLLYDGITTFSVSPSGEVLIERQITTYQTNGTGQADASYLDINTPETLSRLRYEQRQMFALRYPRHKLADDGVNYGAGQPVITPKAAKGELLALYSEFAERGLVEGYDDYKASLIVERDGSDRNRLNFSDQPNLVNQLRVVAGKTQFVV